MLKFITLGAALATVFSTPIVNHLPALAENKTEPRFQANPSLVATDEIINASTEFTHVKTPVLLANAGSNLEPEDLNHTGIMLGLAAAGSVAIGVALRARNAKQDLSTSPTFTHFSSNSQTNQDSLRQASRKLQKKLLRLLHDDQNTANRLISQVKRNNPDRSIDWCVEKVIYDLERDRGSY